MCGIALILSGVRVSRSNIDGEAPITHPDDEHNLSLYVAELKTVLLRRGPDSIGEKKVLLRLTNDTDDEKNTLDFTIEHLSNSGCVNSHSTSHSSCNIQSSNSIFSIATSSSEENLQEKGIVFAEQAECNLASVLEIAFPQEIPSNVLEYATELRLIGATLQLRGVYPILQPLTDASGNILIYNGEIFGGVHVDVDTNDSEALLHALEHCCPCDCYSHGKDFECCSKKESCVSRILSSMRGPWSLIYWQSHSRTLWFGRDAFGRRSLLVHWPTFDEPQFVLSSVSPPMMKNSGSAPINGSGTGKDLDNLAMAGDSGHWDELPCGIYSVCLGELKSNTKVTMQSLAGTVRKHDWTDPLLRKLIQWERVHVDPRSKMRLHDYPTATMNYFSSHESDEVPLNASDLGGPSGNDTKHLTGIQSTHKLLVALRESVMRRTISSTIFQRAGEAKSVPVAILFSGGLDSMILAALLDGCLNSKYTIDLLNVSFDGINAPDRISARAGLKELQRISPSRRWQLVEIDAELSNLGPETKHLLSLINPAKTYMDLNIGIALWLAARGEGFVDGDISNHEKQNCRRYKYKSNARILLVGSGADEQCAGYGRHRTKYKSGGWVALEEEMKLDMQRIWRRNLGRDDRCISDHGKEARFPFLDEDVINTLLELPLWEIANLDEPIGKGDKKILREVAKLLGIEGAAVLPKRAIQFGSRIARESNRKNFGSNRAANQASAGSVIIGTAV